jgi:glutaredoxin-related protein
MTKVAYIGGAQARVAETINARPVVFFMKGSPSRPEHA